MNAVGIDVSKGKSMVTILRPFGEIVSSPFEIKHTSSDIPSWSKILITILFAKSSPTKLILSRLPATLLTNGKVLNRIVLQMNYALS